MQSKKVRIALCNSNICSYIKFFFFFFTFCLLCWVIYRMSADTLMGGAYPYRIYRVCACDAAQNIGRAILYCRVYICMYKYDRVP